MVSELEDASEGVRPRACASLRQEAIPNRIYANNQSLRMTSSAPPTRSRLGLIGRNVKGVSREYQRGII
jgi:hypothetical protein